jgi:2,5-diketo-D-gluconate reductase A
MENKNQSSGINRRRFLQTGSAFAVATMLLPFGGNKIFGLNSAVSGAGLVPSVTLNNGVKMPRLGFGTNTLNGPTCVQSVSDAISAGYRLVDTAHVYGNEEAVGEGIKKSGVKREELFITSKLWVDFYGYDISKKAFQTSIDKLGVEYLDLYLLHRPRGDVKGAWVALEELYKEGKIKAIGVSNFEPKQLDELRVYAKIIPVINQIETHVFFQEHESYKILNKSDVQMEAWSPFAAGRNEIFSNQTLAKIGEKYNKSIAQVCLRWHYQRGVVAIPRSSQKTHIIENLDIFDFELAETDMQTIAKLDLNRTQFPEWS